MVASVCSYAPLKEHERVKTEQPAMLTVRFVFLPTRSYYRSQPIMRYYLLRKGED